MTSSFSSQTFWDSGIEEEKALQTGQSIFKANVVDCTLSACWSVSCMSNLHLTPLPSSWSCGVLDQWTLSRSDFPTSKRGCQTCCLYSLPFYSLLQDQDKGLLFQSQNEKAMDQNLGALRTCRKISIYYCSLKLGCVCYYTII